MEPEKIQSVHVFDGCDTVEQVAWNNIGDSIQAQNFHCSEGRFQSSPYCKPVQCVYARKCVFRNVHAVAQMIPSIWQVCFPHSWHSLSIFLETPPSLTCTLLNSLLLHITLKLCHEWSTLSIIRLKCPKKKTKTTHYAVEILHCTNKFVFQFVH